MHRLFVALLASLCALALSSTALAADPSEVCKAIADAASQHDKGCPEAAKALHAVLDTYEGSPEVLRAAGEDDGCQKTVEPAFSGLVGKCLDSDEVKGAFERLETLAKAGKGASTVGVSVDEPAKATPVAKAKPKAAPAPPDPAIVAKFCLDWAQAVTDFGHKCPALGKRLQRIVRAYDFKLSDIPRNDDAYDASLSTCTEAANATSKCATDKEVKAAMKRLGN